MIKHFCDVCGEPAVDAATLEKLEVQFNYKDKNNYNYNRIVKMLKPSVIIWNTYNRKNEGNADVCPKCWNALLEKFKLDEK